jgi:hypothetical protein
MPWRLDLVAGLVAGLVVAVLVRSLGVLAHQRARGDGLRGRVAHHRAVPATPGQSTLRPRAAAFGSVWYGGPSSRTGQPKGLPACLS